MKFLLAVSRVVFPYWALVGRKRSWKSHVGLLMEHIYN